MYKALKKLLQNGNLNNAVTKKKLDVYLLNGRLTEEEYNELMNMLEDLED